MRARGVVGGAGILVAVLLVVGVPAAAPAAQAATVTTIVQGRVIHLVSTLDPEAAAAMLPGVPVDWDVEVSASRADGVIDVSLGGTATPDAFALTARECATAWSDTGCAAGERMLGTAVAGQSLSLGPQSSAVQRWYRVEVVLARWVPGATATLEFRASGMGTSAPAGNLPSTGGTVAPLFLPALVAIGSGLLIAGVARVARRPAEQRGRGSSG